jgi:hypothetical protein
LVDDGLQDHFWHERNGHVAAADAARDS